MKNTYAIQDCNITGSNKTFTIIGFENTNDTASGVHWSSVTIDEFVGWLTDVQSKFYTLGLKYKNHLKVIVGLSLTKLYMVSTMVLF